MKMPVTGGYHVAEKRQGGATLRGFRNVVREDLLEGLLKSYSRIAA